VIYGHTYNVPIKTSVFKDNWDLSTYRATSVLRILLDNKLSVKQLVASGKGEFSPVSANETPEGRSLNRRTEIILTPKLDMLFQLLENH
jgi:chemotaxis protein MotB